MVSYHDYIRCRRVRAQVKVLEPYQTTVLAPSPYYGSNPSQN